MTGWMYGITLKNLCKFSTFFGERKQKEEIFFGIEKTKHASASIVVYITVRTGYELKSQDHPEMNESSQRTGFCGDIQFAYSWRS